ncbi:unnamed protein product [Porites evermanni]|uniref:Uncharacterized protein n=1 Tax=Porites evermanni TaxID=104178 RepID=A0ABN8LUR2_9CNID|nr:unnamed protein product [Porites evermanni]
MANNFTVCVTQAGRNEKRNGETFATVDWLAYQGAPDGGVSGEMDMPTWWTGTSCRTVSLPSVSSICSILKIPFLGFNSILKMYLKPFSNNVPSDCCHHRESLLQRPQS